MNIRMSWATLGQFSFTWAHWVPYTKRQIDQLIQHINKATRVILVYDGSFGSLKRDLSSKSEILFNFQIFS